tara:strand:- start:10016 stop:10957 length:942 start_codon:yes stop_codon:yes gene_type:complete
MSNKSFSFKVPDTPPSLPKQKGGLLGWLKDTAGDVESLTKAHKPRFKPKSVPGFSGPYLSLDFPFNRDDYQYPASLGIVDLVIQDELEPNFWTQDGKINPAILERLLVIAADFVNSLKIPDIHIDDIIITGSIASYNWYEHSDIDLHILLDFEDVDENVGLVKNFFDAKRMLWNKHHEIMIKGHEVEVYLQETKEAHISPGIYSLLNNNWIKIPIKEEPVIEMKVVEEKALSLMRLIDEADILFKNGDHKGSLRLTSKLKNKIKRMRTSGLEGTGVYSPENLAFKALRKNEYLAKLHGLYTDSYDKIMSMNGV